MRQFLLLGCIIGLLVVNWGCNKHTIKTQKVDQSSQDSSFEQKLKTIQHYLTLAENASQNPDSSDIELYYHKVFEALDQLALTHAKDPAFKKINRQVTESYDDYLDSQATTDGDSLSPDFIQKELEQLYLQESDDGNLTNKIVTNSDNQNCIPIVTNRKVEKAIRYFTKGRGRKVFRKWLERAGSYEPLIKKILKEEKAPAELFYLAMIESGFNTRAHSWARAVGMWQFISATGRAYGLRHNWWFDDRRDPAKATRAAAKHLLDLYEKFGDWYLAIAGYNFSPGKIERRIKKYHVKEFWDLPRLPRETRNYVPTYIAATTIASNPEKYSFNIISNNPVQFDTITVSECVDLNVVAKAVGSAFNEIKALNPALLRWCTPPEEKKWLLNLPMGTRDIFADKYAQIPKEKKVTWAHHRIRSGETLSTIARKYGVRLSEIKKFNKIRGSLIRAGHNLVIPIPANKKYYQKYVASQKTYKKKTTRSRKVVSNVKGRDKHEYLVKKGDSLWEVAQAHNVSVSQIRNWNGLRYSRFIKPGQKLNIWLPKKAGTSAGNNTVAKKKATSQNTLAQSNSAPKVNNSGDNDAITHTVASGETLWDIAQTYSVSIREIKQWNKKRSNTIHPGDALTIIAN